MKKTSIIILTYNQFNYTKTCIESIRKYTKEKTYEIIIVDNNSTDETKEWLKTQKDLKIIYNDENLGFPKGCNQGIEFASVDNDILLLNNDTIVTSNWLENLKICLESDINIGAVGAVCNQNENRQGVSFTYENMEDMQRLAFQNNVSDVNRWEEKVFLIGFCLLIKREVIQKLKQLDEGYSPGYIEDNDLSLRIIQAGYKLMLCHDCFIHHYLGTSFRKDLNKFYPILYKNRDYFYSKWHFNTFAFDEIKSASFPLIEHPLKILELDCGIGVTILSLKYNFKNVEIDGVEKDLNKKKISANFSNIYSSLRELKEDSYDCILIGNLLEKIKNPINFLNKVKKYLKKDGFVVGEIYNAISIHKINTMINNNFPYHNQKNWFTVQEIKGILEKCGFINFWTYSWYDNLTKEEESLLDILENYNQYLKFAYYTFRVQVRK